MPEKMRATSEEDLVFNGINAVTGDYGQPPLSSQQLARLIQGVPSPQDYREFVDRQRLLAGLAQLEDRLTRVTDAQLALSEADSAVRLEELRFKASVQTPYPIKPGAGDPARVEDVGWAVLFPSDMHPRLRNEIREALQPLLDLRREQAGGLFRIYEEGDAYRPGERKDQVLERLGVGAGLVDPREMPFYVLLVGTPEQIPYSFQYQLDVMRGVGRLDFGSDVDAYDLYARHVVAAETGQVALPRRAAFFAPVNSGDRATKMSAQYLVRPIYENLVQPAPGYEIALEHDWEVIEPYMGEGKATHAQLAQLLGGDPAQTPALLLTASHGIEFPASHPAQIRHQGALLCQDWAGLGSDVRREHYFAGEDIVDGSNLLGMVAFFFACYGAGTPELDQFAAQAFKVREKIAPYAFTANLPQQMLKQGALAAIGHVERAWGYSFISPGGQLAHQPFITAMRTLMNGDPIGLATDTSFNMKYAELSSDLSADLDELKWDPGYMDDYELARRWTANNDARSYVVIGDPAARIAFAPERPEPEERPDIGTITAPETETPEGPTEPPGDEAAEDEVPAETTQQAVEMAQPEPPTPPQAAPMIKPWAAADLKPRDTAALDTEAATRAALYDTQAGVAYGLGDQFEKLRDSLRAFTDQLATSLGRAAEDIVTLDVKTYSTKDIAAVAMAFEAHEDVDATLRALTRVAFDGDLQIYVPEKSDSEVDVALWAIHKSMVEEAQDSRAKFLATMAELATSLLDSLKIGT